MPTLRRQLSESAVAFSRLPGSGLPSAQCSKKRPELYGSGPRSRWPRIFSVRPLQVSEIGLADEVAAAASILMGQAAEGRPVALVRGLPYPPEDGRGADLIRPSALDLFH